MRPSIGPAVVCGVLLLLISSCSNSTDYTGQPPIISESKRVITFKALGGEEDVIFTHAKHAEEYWDDNCLACHNHTDVREDTVWGCDQDSCHPADENLGLCYDGDHNIIDCMAAQCTKCHIDQVVNPAPDCVDCHIILNSGVFLDSPVEGLLYWTESQNDLTDSTGGFRYRDGETIEFYVGDAFLGSAVVGPVLTPVDLVPGAQDCQDTTVLNIARFLQTLDENGNVVDGIRIPYSVHTAADGLAISFTVDSNSFSLDPGVVTLLSDLNSGFFGTVFSDGPHTSLVSITDAHTNLHNVLYNLHTPPTASNVAVSGGLYVGGAVSGAFSYHDVDGDPEDGSGSWWYRSDLAGSSNTYLAAGINYSPTVIDQGWYLRYRVWPWDHFHVGSSLNWSAPTGPVTADPSNVTPVVTNVQVSGNLVNTNFVLTGSYSFSDPEGDPEDASVYEWYTDTDAASGGEVLVASATGSQTYQVRSADVNKYIKFRVTPVAQYGATTGTPVMSSAIGPATNSNPITLYMTLGSSSDVETFEFGLTSTTSVIIDIESRESTADAYHDYYTTCSSGCHNHWSSPSLTPPAGPGPSDLGFPVSGPSNGASNDFMVTNFYLFDAADTLIDSRDCTPSACGPVSGCQPGCDALGAGTTRHWGNPLVTRSLAPGTYTLKIGAGPLSESDARADSNSQGWYRYGGYYRVTLSF